MNVLSAFLDRRFREYDFRRGAAAAQRAATEILGIQYTVPRAAGFYEPDTDTSLQCILTDYESLGGIPSTHDPDSFVREVFERALEQRIHTVVDLWNPWGPNFAAAEIIEHLVMKQLPSLW